MLELQEPKIGGREMQTRLLRRIAAADLELPREEGEWLEALAEELPGPRALAAAEHLHGVLPLLCRHFDPEAPGAELVGALLAGERLAGLGLFTPNPAFGWLSAALEARPRTEGVELWGEMRLASGLATAALAPARLEEGGLRWVLVEQADAGVETRAEFEGSSGECPRLWSMRGVAIPRVRISGSADLGPGGPCRQLLDQYAGAYALVAARLALAAARTLRRGARQARHGGLPFQSSQMVAMGLTELEIEARLAWTAARDRWRQRRGEGVSEPSGLSLATASARVWSALAARARELRGLAGIVDPDVPEPGWPCESADVFLGGWMMVESELARTMGL